MSAGRKRNDPLTIYRVEWVRQRDESAARSTPPVPAIYYNRFFAKSGGLISYGIDFAESYRQAAGYIDRVLKGANPGDLPVQQPTKYELIVNMKTATALDLEVPAHLQQAADEVVE